MIALTADHCKVGFYCPIVVSDGSDRNPPVPPANVVRIE
jgi:hypothetical protein